MAHVIEYSGGWPSKNDAVLLESPWRNFKGSVFSFQASRKGASQTVIGFIFGVFELVFFTTSPIFGRYVS